MRLIDADELMEHVWRDKLDSRKLIAEMIEKSPTIKEISTKMPIDVFEKLISQEPRWIPVSERLPKACEKNDDGITAKYYLIQNEYEDMLVARYDGVGWEQIYQSPSESLSFGLYFHNEYIEDRVIAWMPLPEPYKAESERGRTREEATRHIESIKPYVGRNIKDALDMAIKALEQKPYEKFKSAKDHICKLAGDYKCWDNRLTSDEALELCHILEQENVLDKIRVEIMDFEEELFHRPDTDYSDYAAVRHCVEIIDKYKTESEG